MRILKIIYANCSKLSAICERRQTGGTRTHHAARQGNRAHQDSVTMDQMPLKFPRQEEGLDQVVIPD